MNISIVNGSPKTGQSNSQYFAGELEKLLSGQTVFSIRANKARVKDEDLEKISRSEILVLCFPLYVDGIPSHLLHMLQDWELFFREQAHKPRVFAIVNNGFFEGKQTRLALEMVQHWCRRAGLPWGQGIGVGGGEMLGNLTSVPLGSGPKKSLGKALTGLADHILAGSEGDNSFVNPNFPRFAFLYSAHWFWVQQAKKNGVRRRQMYARPWNNPNPPAN